MKSDKQYTTLYELLKSYTNLTMFYHSHKYKAQEIECPVEFNPSKEQWYQIALYSVPIIYHFEDGLCYAMVSANATRSALDRCEYFVYNAIENLCK